MKGTMLALVKKHARPGLWLDEVPIPEIGINDVLIKIHKTAICGTDVHIWNWDAWSQKTIPEPMVVGHEFVGTVAEMGSNVHDLEIGDIVSGEGHIVCGRCRNCLAGRRHLCNATMGVGVNRPGAYGEYLSIPVTNIWHADPNISTDLLAIFDPFGNATHTALEFEVLGEARDGNEAVEMALGLSPDLVVMDIKMPFKSGIEALGIIKAKRPFTRVILYSMYPPALSEGKGLESADRFIPKERLFEDLFMVIEELDCV